MNWTNIPSTEVLANSPNLMSALRVPEEPRIDSKCNPEYVFVPDEQGQISFGDICIDCSRDARQEAASKSGERSEPFYRYKYAEIEGYLMLLWEHRASKLDRSRKNFNMCMA